MPADIADLEARIRGLSPEERRRLVTALIAELDGPADPDAERAWVDEAVRRHRELRDGLVEPVPGDEVFARLRSRFGRLSSGRTAA